MAGTISILGSSFFVRPSFFISSHLFQISAGEPRSKHTHSFISLALIPTNLDRSLRIGLYLSDPLLRVRGHQRDWIAQHGKPWVAMGGRKDARCTPIRHHADLCEAQVQVHASCQVGIFEILCLLLFAPTSTASTGRSGSTFSDRSVS